MTVKELIEVLEQRPDNSKICIGVKGNTYDIDRVVMMQGYDWEIVGNDVVIVGR